MSQHTPGPWAFVQGGSGDFPTWNVRLGDRGLITLPATASMETMDADARLIAAAPDLLNAVRFLLSNPDNRISSADLNAAHAAIAKAEGQQ